MTDYAKDRVRLVSYSEALDKAKHGWVIAREGWNGRNMIVFMAKGGTFEAADLVTGSLEPFLVMRTAQGKYVPWLCSQSDALAEDWACITRQTFARQMGPSITAPVHEDEFMPNSVIRDYRVDQRTSGPGGRMASEDTDFNAD